MVADWAAAEKRFLPDLGNEHGQSVLEFVFMLPILLGLVVVMVRSNTAIQMSVVNQKYARAQALWLTFNSPYYPRLSLRKAGNPEDQFVQYGFNRMVIGMAETPVDDTGGKATASMQAVVRGGVPAPEGPSQSEPIDRAKVRIRTTVALCTQTNVIVTEQGLKPASGSNIGEKTVFDYCRGQDE